ncbi:MAG: SHOCT domain-containing protein [Candidatus Weimeria sp.]
MQLTNKEWEAELSYQSVMSVFKHLLRKTVISKDDYIKVEEHMRKKYSPVSSDLLSRMDLIQ